MNIQQLDKLRLTGLANQSPTDDLLREIRAIDLHIKSKIKKYSDKSGDRAAYSRIICDLEFLSEWLNQLLESNL